MAEAASKCVFNFIFSKHPPFRSLGDKLATRRLLRLKPRRIRPPVIKSYTLATVKWATRDIFRNGLHRRRREQAFAEVRAFGRARGANHKATGRFYAPSRTP